MESGRLVCAVEIHHKPVSCSCFCRPPVEVHHRLVVPVHEVYLEAFYSHFGVMATHFLHVPVEGKIACPENKSHIFPCSVVREPFQVYFRYHLHQIGFPVHSPSFVKDDIFYPVFCRKVYVMSVSFVVDSSLEVHPAQIPVVPPFPCDFSRLHPAEVCFRVGRGCQPPHHVAVGEFLVFRRHNHCPPRERCSAVVFRYIVLAAHHHSFKHVVSALLHLIRITCEYTFQRFAPIAVVKVHSRIVNQIRFSYADFLPVGCFHYKRQECEPAAVPLADFLMYIGVFKRVPELAFKVIAEVPHIRNVCLPVFRK